MAEKKLLQIILVILVIISVRFMHILPMAERKVTANGIDKAHRWRYWFR